MKKFWEYLNGKKTNISVGLFFLATLLQEVVINMWEVRYEYLPKIISTINWFAMVIGTTGISHRFMKFKRMNEGEEEPKANV